MKKMKKLVSLLLALVMALAMALPVSAATKIKIDGAKENETYVAYKLMDATESADGENFSYALNPTYAAALKEICKVEEEKAVIDAIGAMNSEAIRTFADAVYKKIKGTGTANTDYYTITGGELDVPGGYYLIAQTTKGDDKEETYSLVMLDTVGQDEVTVTPKRDVPELVKKVQDINDTTGEQTDWQDSADYDIGDEVPFQLTATLPEDYASYEKYYLTFHDKMSEGLTFKGIDRVVYVGENGEETPITAYDDKAPAEDGHSLDVIITDLKTAAKNAEAGGKVIVYFKAVLNEKAKIGSEGNPNTAYLEYSNNPYDTGEGKPETGETPEDKVIVFTYELTVDKVNGKDDPLKGAGFTLYKVEKGIEKEIKTIEAGETTTFSFKGLDDGEYVLKETTVPDGYNPIDEIRFTITATHEADSKDPQLVDLTVNKDNFTTDKNNGTIATKVKNLSGAELPEAGGMGTTLIYLMGAVLVLGAGTVLVLRRRTGKDME